MVQRHHLLQTLLQLQTKKCEMSGHIRERRGPENNLSSEEAFQSELYTSSLDSLTEEVDYTIPITTDGSKTRVWLKVSDFSWVSGVIESGDERFE